MKNVSPVKIRPKYKYFVSENQSGILFRIAGLCFEPDNRVDKFPYYLVGVWKFSGYNTLVHLLCTFERLPALCGGCPISGWCEDFRIIIENPFIMRGRASGIPTFSIYSLSNTCDVHLLCNIPAAQGIDKQKHSALSARPISRTVLHWHRNNYSTNTTWCRKIK